MKIIALILSLLLLTSCSNPDTSGGVTLSRGGDDANEFPYGSCEGQHENTPDLNTGCGWIHVNEESHYIMPYANLYDRKLRYAYLTGADLRYAYLTGADLYDATLSGADLRYADLTHAGLRYANLRGADLSGADLSDADLRYAELRNADLSGARLRGARLWDVRANSSTTCPNGKKFGTAGHDCPF